MAANKSYKKQSSGKTDVEKVNAKNTGLRNEVNKLAGELAHKNRELQIEASLEKVRSSAMSMKKPDDLLTICKILYGELLKLGFTEMRNAMINIHNDDKSSFLNYDFSDYAGKTSTNISYNDLPEIANSVNKIREGDNAFSEFSITGKELKDWKAFRKSNGEYDDQRIENSSALYYYFYSIGTGAIGISTFSSIDKEKLKVLKRFRNVFNLCYQRYTDIVRAEAHAKETLIELALERIRVRSMAMHNSDELVEASDVLFEQLKSLGIESIRTGVAIFDEIKETLEIWSRSHAGSKPENKILGVVPKNSHEFFKKCFDSWKSKKEKYFSYEIKGAEVKKYYKSMSSILSYPETKIFNPREFFYIFFFPEGSLNVVRHDPLTEEEISLMQRFASVFGLIYRRFLDLQKAEAQTREAMIEASLERVRSKAMAMHNSDDLTEAAGTVFTELNKLGINPIRSGFVLLTNNSRNAKLYPATSFDKENTISFTGEFEFTGHPIYEKQYESWQKSVNYFPVLEGKVLRSYYKILSKGLSVPLSNFSKNKKQYGSFLPFSEGFLFAWSDEPYMENEINILDRFKNILHLTIRRFLDLKKAEAQSREAQIELALERVRARTMAMQHSDELSEAALILFQQVQSLGIKTGSCGYNIWEKDGTTTLAWMSSPEGGFQPPFKMPHTVSPIYKRVYNAKQEGKDVYTEEVKGELLKKHFKYLLEVPVIQNSIQKYIDEGYPFPEKMTYHIVFFKQGYLTFHTNDLFPEYREIFKRFGKVFEQTYTRFLDLQKAEAQTREAKIEAALERVRSKAMAMHRSEDLSDAVAIVFEELDKLDMKTLRCGISIINKEKRTTDIWSTTKTEKGNIVQVSGDESMDIHPMLRGAYEAWLKQEDHSYLLKGKELIKFYEALADTNFKLPDSPEEIKSLQQHMYVAHFPVGGLYAFRETEFPEEAKSLLRRFGNVFNLTYKRFLDIQKAEAQARESQIQLALERVRARTLAMHESDELEDVADILFLQLKELGIVTVRSYIGIFRNNRLADLFGAGEIEKFKRMVSDDNNGLISKMFDAWRKKKHSTAINTNENQFECIAYFSSGLVAITSSDYPSLETINLLERFAGVFNLTYTRFLDLQQAEAQAREAKIEAAFERVRSKAMAMHKSEDLNDAVAVVFEEMDKLNLGTERCGIGILDKEKRIADVFTTTKSDEGMIVQISGAESMEIHPLLEGAFNAWIRQEDFSYLLEGKDLNNYYRALAKTNFNLPDSHSIFLKDKGLRQYYYVTSFHAGGLFAFRKEEFTEEAKSVMKRFAGVFNLTYKRFLDIQKAEAQAREAQIEIALEKVRSRTMAMQKTYELDETAAVLQQQLKDLGINLISSSICVIPNIETLATTSIKRIASVAGIEPLTGRVIPELSNHTSSEASSGSKLSLDFFGTGKERIPDWLTNKNILKDVLSGFINKKKFITDKTDEKKINNFAYFSHGFLCVTTSEESHFRTKNLLEKFAGVFDLTYKRFMDLQKAEAQIRDAQIEAALERARTQSMIMQHSNELDKTSQVFHEQLELLGIDTDFSYLWLPDEKKNEHSFWATWKENKNGNTIFFNKAVSYPLNKKDPAVKECFRAWDSGEQIHVYFVNPDEVKNYFAAWEELLRGAEKLKPEYFKEGLYYVEAFMKYGCFGIFIRRQLTEDEKKILGRFTIEFERAYTRFLDLKKAEAQSRESQIELALERIRARTMAMQSSEELSETAFVLFQQFKELGDVPIQITIGIINEEKGIIEFRATDVQGSGSKSDNVAAMSIKEPTLISKIYNAWKEKKKSVVIELEGKELIQWANYRNESTGIHTKIDYPGGKRAVIAGYFSKGLISYSTDKQPSPESILLLERFAGVFDQTYTRFLDLKQAEAQAREAKIEAALEKVRSRTMGMQQSGELGDVATILFKQLNQLVDNLWTCGFVLCDKDRAEDEWWLSTGDGFIPAFYLPNTGDRTHANIYNAWKKGETYHTEQLEAEALQEHYDWLMSIHVSKNIFDEMKAAGNSLPGWQKLHCAYFSYGYLVMIT
ncbi:MAG: hypothetical protein ABI462_07705, partial [Ignavibacteria bacterium]